MEYQENDILARTKNQAFVGFSQPGPSSYFPAPGPCSILPPLKRLLSIFLSAISQTWAFQTPDPIGAARRAMSDGLYDVAALRLGSALDSNDVPPADKPAITLLLAENLVRSARYGQASLLLSQESLQDLPATPFWKAQALAGQGEFTEAIELLLPLSKDPTHPLRSEAAFTASSLLLSLDRDQQALDVLQPFSESEYPQLGADSTLRRVRILLDLGRLPDARSLLFSIGDIPDRFAETASLLAGYLAFAEGDAAASDAKFSEILAMPGAGSVATRNLAIFGKADALAARNENPAAIELLLTHLHNNPETASLPPVFDRIIAWLPPAIPSVDDPLLRRLAAWLPTTTPPGDGFINSDPDTASSAWPRASPLPTDLQLHAQYTRALALRRVNDPAAREEANQLLLRLPLLAPGHPLARRGLLQLARWDLQAGSPSRAFHILEILSAPDVPPDVKGEAAFLLATASFDSGDPARAATWFDQAASSLPGPSREAAALNAAYSRLSFGSSDPVTIQNVDPETALRLNTTLALERALVEKDPAKARTLLEQFLEENPNHPRSHEARLAITEAALAAAPPDLQLAREQLNILSAAPHPPAPGLPPRIALARLRIADLSGNSGETIPLAKLLVETFPDAAAASEATLILGRNQFRTGDYNDARLSLEKLAGAEPGSQRAQAALLLAARAAALGATARSREEALVLFDRAITDDGPLRTLARLEKARLLIDLDRLPDAITLLSSAYEATSPDDPSRLPTGLLLAEAIYAQGDEKPESLSKALEIYDDLLDLSAGSPAKYFRLQYLRGLTLEKLPDPSIPGSTRLGEALSAYYSVLDRPTDPPPPEWEWFERAGFRALYLLENAARWKAAISLARKIASFNGPRAGEAATRARQLRLKHMIWED